MLCPGSEAGIAEVSLHPVHLLDSMERALPAALIPFCSYQANMSLLGNPGDQFPFVACGKFQPYLLEGQLCYSLHLRDFVSGGSLGGKGNGLLLVLDPVINSYKNVPESENKDKSKPSLILYNSTLQTTGITKKCNNKILSSSRKNVFIHFLCSMFISFNKRMVISVG